MDTETLNAEKLLRQVLANIAELPPTDLLVVYETINDLKHKNETEPAPLTSAEILARAKIRAAEMQHLSHAEVVQRFIDATDRIRADAIANGTGIDGEWEGD